MVRLDADQYGQARRGGAEWYGVERNVISVWHVAAADWHVVMGRARIDALRAEVAGVVQMGWGDPDGTKVAGLGLSRW